MIVQQILIFMVNLSINFLSTIYCSKKKLLNYHGATLYLLNNYQFLFNSNISNSYCNWYSLIFENSNGKYLFNSFININTFSNSLWFYKGIHHMSNSNIINNTHITTGNAIVYNQVGTTLFDYNILYNNSNSVFEKISGILNVQYCYSDSYSFTTGRSATFTNNFNLITSTYNLKHLNLSYCENLKFLTNNLKNFNFLFVYNLFIFLVQ